MISIVNRRQTHIGWNCGRVQTMYAGHQRFTRSILDNEVMGAIRKRAQSHEVEICPVD